MRVLRFSLARSASGTLFSASSKHAAVRQTSAVTLGNFDGLHLGHRALLQQTLQSARALAAEAVVVTFEPHPRDFFSPTPQLGRLATLREKLKQLAQLGVDTTVICRFDEAMATCSAETFIETLLVDRLAAQSVWVGNDFRFGHRRSGDVDLLRRAGRRHGFTVGGVAAVCDQSGERISSSRLREALARGELAAATRLLGSHYKMAGRVIAGAKLARTLGFPTANLRVRHQPLPLTGVFVVDVVHEESGQTYQGVANLGNRPTVDGVRCLLEVHLFDFTGDLYHQHLQVSFVHKLRDEQRFADLAALKAQIAVDVDMAKAIALAGR